MREGFARYFLSSYNFSNEFERSKATSLLFISVAMGIFFLVVGIAQKGADMSNIIVLGDLAGIVGVGLTLFLIKNGRIDWAGEVLISVCLSVICIADLYDDWVSPKQQAQYKIYVSLVSLLGTYLLCLSFFREKQKFFLYAFIGAIIITVHAAIIYHHPLHTEQIREAIGIHYLVGIAGIVLSATLFNLIIITSENLLEQNIKISRQIQLQNEDLERTVAARTKALKNSNDNLQEFAYVVSLDL